MFDVTVNKKINKGVLKMRIIDGKKFYQKEIDAAERIDNDGWDSYNGQNYQWYTLKYNPKCGLVQLIADNSGSCYGDYEKRYFSSPRAFANYCNMIDRDWTELLGDIDENNVAVMDFVDKILGNRKTAEAVSL
jgi:hypothetical protein